MKTEEIKSLLEEAVKSQKKIIDSYYNKKKSISLNAQNVLKDVLDKIKQIHYYIENNLNEFTKEADKLNFYSYDNDFTKFGVSVLFKKVDFYFSNKLMFLTRDRFSFYVDDGLVSSVNFNFDKISEKGESFDIFIETTAENYLKIHGKTFVDSLNEVGDYVKSDKFINDIDDYLKEYFTQVIEKEINNDVELTKTQGYFLSDI